MNRSLKQCLKMLPHYNVPCRTTFSRTLISQLYMKTKHEIQSSLNKALASGELESISITCDMWTSKSNQSYIGVTCHFISSEDFEIKSYCLGNIHFPENHTGIEIAGKLNALLDKWKLTGGTIPIYAVTDNARSMVFGISHTSFIHMSCFAHSLQLTISDAVKKTEGLDKMLSIARALVGHFKRSPQATTRLLALQERLGETKHALIQDCPTRWNSQYLMLERLVEHKESISAVSVDDDGITCLYAQQWIMASAYVKLLQPFDEATTTVSSETKPTLLAVIPIVHGLESFLTDYINKNLTGKVFARSLLQSLKSRFPYYLRVENNIKMLAMMIDPRYKTTILPNCDHQWASALLMSEVKNMSAPRPNPAAIAHADQGLQTEADAVSTPTTSLWSAFALQTKRQNILANDDQVEIAYEIKQFFNLPVVNEDPCGWWNSNCSKFPSLAKAARKFLSTPATEVASERVFSAAGNIISKRRQSLRHEHVEQLVFLQQNSRV